MFIYILTLGYCLALYSDCSVVHDCVYYFNKNIIYHLTGADLSSQIHSYTCILRQQRTIQKSFSHKILWGYGLTFGRVQAQSDMSCLLSYQQSHGQRPRFITETYRLQGCLFCLYLYLNSFWRLSGLRFTHLFRLKCTDQILRITSREN